MERLRQLLNIDSLKNNEFKRKHELSAEAYLESLSEQDRENIQGFLSLAENLDGQLPFVRIAVTAVGSTTIPEEQRRHPAEDIDLRILNSSPVSSHEREGTVLELQDLLKGHLTDQEMEFMENSDTDATQMVEGYSGGKKELLPFADYNSSDPSFTVQFPEGLPFHISISGVDSYDLDSHLQKERESNSNFALLYES